MWQKLPVNNFEWIKDTFQFNKDFIKNYNEESYAGYFLKVDVQYLGKLHELQNNLPLLPEFVKHIRNFKQALNHGLVLNKVQRVIKFGQNDWLKPHICTSTDLKKAKQFFEKDFFKLMNNSVFGKKTKRY